MFFCVQGVRFDPDLPQTLRLEFAKSNTKVTKPKQQSPQPAATHPTLIHPLAGRKWTAFLYWVIQVCYIVSVRFIED